MAPPCIDKPDSSEEGYHPPRIDFLKLSSLRDNSSGNKCPIARVKSKTKEIGDTPHHPTIYSDY